MEESLELNLRDYWIIFTRRMWEFLIAFVIVFSSFFIYTSLLVPMYRVSVTVKIQPPTYRAEVILPMRTYNVYDYHLSDYVKQIVSSPVIEEAAKELGWIKEGMSKTEKERIVSYINSSVSVTEISGSNLMQLYVQMDNPVKAAGIANKITEVFKRQNVEQQNLQAKNVRIFIEEMLKDVSAKLQKEDDKLRVLTIAGASGMAVNMIQQISVLEKNYMDLLAKFTEKHPSVIGLKEEIGTLKAQLKNLPKEEFEYGILRRDISVHEKLYIALKDNLQSAQIKEAEKIDNVLIISPAIQPRYPYFPNKPRNYGLGVILGLILGITTALTAEHLDTSIGRVDDIEKFIKVSVLGTIPYCTERREKEAQQDKKRHAIFFKKNIKKASELKPTFILELEKSESASLFLEAFRLLGVNLQVLFGKGDRIKNQIILITSCKPEEGKTLVVSTLGIILSQMGYRVLILDADVRRAHIHKSFGLKEKGGGLTDILIGKITADAAVRTATDIMLGAAAVDKVIEQPWLNNINIVTAGATFPNTINLFNSRKLDDTLNYFKNKYDIVLIDTSPVLAVSEPSILVPKVDGVLLIYRAGSTSRIALRRAKIQLESLKKGILSGVILNNVTPEIGMNTYYYYNKKYYNSEDKESQGSNSKNV
jgi:Mrp family chromosome partitioning ATPase/uncharacterized protein involved in exopolysaccharide biosynthesis